MKKIFLAAASSLLLVANALAVTPVEIIGKWASNPVSQTDPTTGFSSSSTTEVVFKEDGKMESKSKETTNFEVAPGVKLYVYTSYEGQGTYTAVSDSISMALDPATIKFNFTEDDIRITGVEDPTQADEMKSQMFQGMSQAMEQTKDMIAQPEVLKNVMVVGKKMTCTAGDLMVTFKRKK